jgi:hypothetical protein
MIFVVAFEGEFDEVSGMPLNVPASLKSKFSEQLVVRIE